MPKKKTPMNDEKKISNSSEINKSEPPIIRKTIPELYRSVDLDGTIVDCNEDYAKRLGYSVDEVIGMSLFDHCPKENYEQIKNSFETWKKTGKVVNRRVTLVTKDGVKFDVLITATNRLNADKKLVGTDTIIRDISELKWLQDLVKVRKYESLYENSPDLYRTVNYQGIIVDCNKAYEDALGYSKDEIIGISLFEHTGEKSISEMRTNMAYWRKTGAGKTTEVWMKKKDGTTFPASLTSTNLYDDDGALIGRNVVIKDTSTLHETQEHLSELEKVEKLKEEFLSMVTHELKSPLTPIIGFCQALKRPKILGELNEQQMDAVETIIYNSTRLQKLIGDLLDVHKLDLGKMTFDYSQIDVAELAHRIISSFGYVKKEKGIDISCNFTEKLFITSDKDRLTQVISNLIYNAVDFVPKETGKIELVIEKKDSDVLFSILDNGIGIPKEKQKKLFSKFYKVDTSANRKHGGSGLGLPICKGIVDNLGGSIGVESEVNKGSKFYFTIPIEKKGDTK